VVKARSTTEQQHSQQVQGLEEIIQLQMNCLAEKDETIAQNEETIAELRQQIQLLERQLGCVNQQLEESERVNAQFQRRIAELEQLRPATDKSSMQWQRAENQHQADMEGGRSRGCTTWNVRVIPIRCGWQCSVY
jgi:chromosome segregation ATPase